MRRLVKYGVQLIVAVVWLAAVPAAAQIQAVAYRFESAPLVDPAVYVRLNRPVAGDAVGKAVAFHAKVRIQGAGGSEGIFTADPVAADMLEAQRYDVAPPAAAFRKFDRPTINVLGDVAWKARLTNGTQGVFRTGPLPVALAGDAAVPLAMGTFERFDLPIITDDGQVVFHADIFGGPIVGPITVGAAIARCFGGDGNCHSGTGTPQVLVAEGDLLPDRPGRMICDLLPGVGASTFGISFRAVTKLDCGNAAEPELSGVFRLPFAGGITTVALQGESAEPVPGVSGTVYDVFDDVAYINNVGGVTFRSSVTGVFSLNSIYVCDAALCPLTPATIAVSHGDLDVEGNVLTRLSSPHISDVGDVALRAEARGVTRKSGVFVWRVGTDTVERIAGKSDPVPGEVNTYFNRVDRPWMSPGGRIAFGAITKGPGPSKRGLFLFE